ncbi:coiled-coil domain-containing protein 136 isoform X1 [Anopheles arabiensis]|uniref:coiled-coil domain-containing protein 136 isoform X1 n=1 Tax=Anopheles arabiensis TaxID=7173 RepID=UPI001AAD5405|nr:coiled-coil domain-containing protein 136 isoform X1 [Anopheles arabiensis]
MSAQLNGLGGRWSGSKARTKHEPATQSAAPGGDSEESSLDEFLEHELLCWLNEDKPIGQEVATLRPELYGELHQLLGVATEADNRCVEDILAEAERLMLQDGGSELPVAAGDQSPVGWGELLLPPPPAPPPPMTTKWDESGSPFHRPQRIASPACAKVLELTGPVHCNGTGERRQQPAESTKASNNRIRSPPENPPPPPTPPPPAQQPSTPTTPTQRRHIDQPTAIKAKARLERIEPTHHSKQTATESSPVVPYRGRLTCDRSTQPSPDDEPDDRCASWAKERLLEGQITELQERLKDTEERYHSLKLQYDTLSQVHRTLRENYGTLQEESEKLQFDIQHLTKCADVLRSELQSARCDRDSAIELQKILQSELDESRRERKKLQDGGEKDTKTIQDLQRQCREMERILMRKNPDSISALIVASKSPTGKPEPDGSNSTTCRLLEQRIAQLEADARKQDAKAQGILADVQARFNSVQAKYETHIADLEMQVLSLQEINSKLNEKIIRQMEELASIGSHAGTVNGSTASFTQTDATVEGEEEEEEPRGRKREAANAKVRSILVQTDVTGEAAPAAAATVVVPAVRQPSAKRAQAQGKEDAHLLATIRGMRVDLAIKEKAVQRLTREVEECKKTIKKLQKKKEPGPVGAGNGGGGGGRGADSSGRSPVKVRSKPESGGECGAGPEPGALRDAQSKVKLLELDYKALQEKRLQDLKTLQAAHEKELASCHESIRFLQQRLAESEEELLLQRKDSKHRPNHGTDYYGLKAKRMRPLKRAVAPRVGRLATARYGWHSAGSTNTPGRSAAALVHLLANELHCTKSKLLLGDDGHRQ